MHSVAVHNEKHLAWYRAHQAAQKIQKDLGGETSLEHLKAQGTAVGQAGDNVATEALASRLHDWGLAFGCPAGAGLMVRAQAHLVAKREFERLPAEPAGAGQGSGSPSSLGRLQGTAPGLVWPAFAAIAPKRAGSGPLYSGIAGCPTAAG